MKQILDNNGQNHSRNQKGVSHRRYERIGNIPSLDANPRFLLSAQQGGRRRYQHPNMFQQEHLEFGLLKTKSLFPISLSHLKKSGACPSAIPMCKAGFPKWPKSQNRWGLKKLRT